MAEYIEVSEDKWTKIDGDKAEVLKPSALVLELEKINERLTEIPAPLSEDELIAWARTHYPALDYSVEKQSLENRKSVIEIDLSNMGL